MKIVFVGLYNEQNLGDPIIQDSTEWLFCKHLGVDFDQERLFLDYVTKKWQSSIVRKCLGHICKDVEYFSDKNVILRETERYFRKYTKKWGHQ